MYGVTKLLTYLYGEILLMTFIFINALSKAITAETVVDAIGC